MRPETTRCPLMTKDPVRPALCWKEFCELYDDEAKCCSIRLIAIRLGQIFGIMAQKPFQVQTEKKAGPTMDRKIEAPQEAPSDEDFKLVE